MQAQQVPLELENSEQMLTYSRGQPVIPAYEGWTPKPDGTIDLWFGYLNQNWREEVDVPVGANNFISPEKYGLDSGQPTHFLPRNNRWVFTVTVPKDFPEKEVVWTLTSKGKTYRAYATLHPGYVKDDSGLMREYFGSPPAEGNQPPEITVSGDLTRTIKVGEASTLRVIVKDDGIPRSGGDGDGGGGGGGGVARTNTGTAQEAGGNVQGRQRGSICGANRNPFFCGEPTESAGSLSSVKGLRMNCFLYRGGPEARAKGDFGNAGLVTFDPPQEKAWEDHRGGSPWAGGYRLPPVPKDNTWVIQASFKEPGTYQVRCQAHDGLLVTNKQVAFTVTP
jgi:hypothetical protein